MPLRLIAVEAPKRQPVLRDREILADHCPIRRIPVVVIVKPVIQRIRRDPVQVSHLVGVEPRRCRDIIADRTFLILISNQNVYSSALHVANICKERGRKTGIRRQRKRVQHVLGQLVVPFHAKIKCAMPQLAIQTEIGFRYRLPMQIRIRNGVDRRAD